MEEQLKDNIKPSPKEMYDALAHQIEREDNLVNNRINWFLASQGFLFAAVGVIISSELHVVTKVLSIAIIAALGISIGVIIKSGVKGADLAIEKLRKQWNHTEVFFRGYFPPPFGMGRARDLGGVPRTWLPRIIIMFWFLILVAVLVGLLKPEYFEMKSSPQKIIIQCSNHNNLEKE